ncbi:hypothetical protein [Acuticoccus sp. I52.16.1]|uniref:hypothetical protein n=1 Tax=Acuticoccus sp. I52.16.1 TaxID=2928472 RepID=UPI001FCF9322|nr:hypothetical protein [Acuticoccus sp. I52.16.1]UOM34642.1 hypothetical protein MRB58_00030 [Acuticoccus sp. I52.16.1]
MLLALGLSAPALAQSQDLPPAQVETRDTGRIFLDGQVAEVYVDNFKTIAIMAQAPQSACPSNEYVYERDRPKWLFETGRLLVAAEEGADIRVSFTCYSGLQSINAIQFLSPATRRVISGTPSQARLVPTSVQQGVLQQGVPVTAAPPSRSPATRQVTRASDTPATATDVADRGLVVPGGGAYAVVPPAPGAYAPAPTAAQALPAAGGLALPPPSAAAARGTQTFDFAPRTQ